MLYGINPMDNTEVRYLRYDQLKNGEFINQIIIGKELSGKSHLIRKEMDEIIKEKQGQIYLFIRPERAEEYERYVVEESVTICYHPVIIPAINYILEKKINGEPTWMYIDDVDLLDENALDIVYMLSKCSRANNIGLSLVVECVKENIIPLLVNSAYICLMCPCEDKISQYNDMLGLVDVQSNNIINIVNENNKLESFGILWILPYNSTKAEYSLFLTNKENSYLK